MKKLVILNYGFLVFAAVFCGCQTPIEGPSDEQLINTIMAEWKAAVEAKDIDRLMVLFSENYMSASGSSPASVMPSTKLPKAWAIPDMTGPMIQ